MYSIIYKKKRGCDVKQITKIIAIQRHHARFFNTLHEK
jgi:hypothetical protein